MSSPRTAMAELRVIDGGRSGRPELSEAELIAAVRCRDSVVADALYDHLRGVVEGTLFRMLGARGSDHDDLVQSAFEQIIKTLRSGRFAHECSLRAWAAVITTRIALNTIRARRRHRLFWDSGRTVDDAASHVASADDVHQEVAARRELHRVRLYLSELARPKALTLILHDMMGYDIAQIAQLMGATKVNTQSRLARARRELRQRLDRDEGQGDGS